MSYTYFILPDTSGHATETGELVVADIPLLPKDYLGGYRGEHHIPDSLVERVSVLSETERDRFLADNGYSIANQSES